jgi:hypothetical protein
MTYEKLNGFSFGETGYGFDGDGCMYACKYDEHTWNMDWLYKTKKLAILAEIEREKRDFKERIEELENWLEDIE